MVLTKSQVKALEIIAKKDTEIARLKEVIRKMREPLEKYKAMAVLKGTWCSPESLEDCAIDIALKASEGI